MNPVIEPEFAFHKLNEEGQNKAKTIALYFSDLLFSLQSYCPASRELSIVKTKLEEACFFAKKAMANQPKNQVKVIE